MKELTFTGVGNSLTVELLEHWVVTPYLRWVDRPMPWDTLPTLQQLWQGSNGSQKWEDVQTVREE